MNPQTQYELDNLSWWLVNSVEAGFYTRARFYAAKIIELQKQP